MVEVSANVIELVGESRHGVVVYPLDVAGELGVDAVFTGREGGASDAPYDSLNLGDHVGDEPVRVHENRRRVATALGVEASELVIVRQVHGTEVLPGSDAHSRSEGDGLLGGGDGRALAILVADCVPVLLIERASARFAVVHAGWRGLAAGVLANALGYFDDSRRVRAVLGPAISGDAYQIGPDVAVHFTEYRTALSRQRGDRSLLDLRLVAYAQLVASGLLPSEVFVTRQVTDGGATFFSDRAQRPCGRFALVAKRSS